MMETTNHQNQAVDTNSAQSLALARCDNLIEWYQRNQKQHHHLMTLTRLVAIVLSGLVPVLVIIQMSLRAQTVWWLTVSVLIALFPASATIVSTLNDLFQYKENWIRFSIALEELKSEKMKYLTRTTKAYQRELDDYEALTNFVSRVEAITLRETRKWQVQAEQTKELDEALKSMDQRTG